MKKLPMIIPLVILLCITFSCQKTSKPVDIEAEKTQIVSVLNSYVTSVENEDMELYAQNMAHDSDMINFGGFGDPIIGWDALIETMKGQNASLSETEINMSDLKIHVWEDGKSGWATCLWNLKAIMGENPIELPIRCTWILEKRDNRWIIVHWHKSMAMKG